MIEIAIIGEGFGPRLLEQHDEMREKLYPGYKGVTQFIYGKDYRDRYEFLQVYNPEKTSIVLVSGNEIGPTRMLLISSAESLKYKQAAGKDVSDEDIKEMKICGRELADYIRKDKTDRETYYIISEAWEFIKAKHSEDEYR